ncbi:MAG: SDR family NAD(P)-dependent oxidoreductase [Aureispira sp.]
MSRLLEWFLFPPTGLSIANLHKKIAHKTILITGASYGIGAQTAHLLAAPTVHLILVARTQTRLQTLQKELEYKGATVDFYATDLTAPTQVDHLIQQLQQQPQPIDIIINNAGHSILRSIHQAKDRYHDFERTMAINYLGPVRLLLPLLRDLETQNGHLINVSALNVLLLPAPYWAAYQASKTAFDQWFRCVAPELRAKGVQCSSIYFPLVRTRMIAPTQAYQNTPALSPQQAATILGNILLTQKTQYKPWWAVFAQLGSAFFRQPWEWGCTWWIKHRTSKSSSKQ